MIEPQVPQDRVSIQPENQHVGYQCEHEKPTHDLGDFRWPRIIGVMILMMLIGVVAWVLISDGGKFLASIFENLIVWFDQATIDPHDSKGFTSFIKLTLTAGFIALILYFISKK
jgi:hypothetical protein